MLEGQLSAQFGVLELYGSGFYICTLLHFLSALSSCPVPAAVKHRQPNATTTRLHCRDGDGLLKNGARLPSK